MFNKHTPLLFIAMTLISIKVSTEAYSGVYIKEPKTLELSGLKISTPERKLASDFVAPAPLPTTAALPIESTPKTQCLPIENLKKYKENFIDANKEALNKILGPWYFKIPKTPDYDYSFYSAMSPTEVYVSAIIASKQPKASKNEKDYYKYIPSSLASNIYYKNRDNADAIFYMHHFYKKMEAPKSSFDYLKNLFKEASEQSSLSLEVNKLVIKLSKDPESLLGAFELLKDFRGLSSDSYILALMSLEKESRTDLAKLMIKAGDDKANINAHIEWSPAVYKAAYKTLADEEMARSYETYDELKKIKSESNNSFVDKLERVKTDCELEEIWSIAGPSIRDL